jgi:CHAT domain-containing protein
MPTDELQRYLLAIAYQRVAGEIAVALAFRAADADPMLAFETAVTGKGLFTEIGRRQRQSVNRARASDGEELTQRYLDLRRRVAGHVLDSWRRARNSFQAEPSTVSALFGEIREVERTLLRFMQSGPASEKQESGLGKRIVSSLDRDQVLLEFVSFVPIDMKAVRELDVNALVREDPSARHYGVFVVSGATRKVTAIDLGPVGRIDNALLEYRHIQQSQSATTTFNLNEAILAKSAEPLRRLLIEPFAIQLRDARRIYIAAEGAINLLPFEAMTLGTSTLRYLIEDYEVVYLTTGRDLLRTPPAPTAARRDQAWLFADPDFDAQPTAVIATGGAASLKPTFTKIEPTSPGELIGEAHQMGAGSGDEPIRPWRRLARTRDLIGTILGVARSSGMSPLILTDAHASERSAGEMRSPRLVVFATHGKFLERAPRIQVRIKSLTIGGEDPSVEFADRQELLAADPLFRSMLVLAGANRSLRAGVDEKSGDGLLTAYEVWGLNLDGTELVALAACETGLGVVQAVGATSLLQPHGEQVAGLRQAFLIAGARSIVMSMWQVPVGETVRLFDRFLTRWLSGRETRYTAFRLAQLDSLRYARENLGSGHPFWWAGFVFAGNPGDNTGGR